MNKIGRVTTASVYKATGRHWDEWLAILDKAGAISWKHGEIARWLGKRHKLRPWWQQGVALGYELARGKRIEGQNSVGEYSLTATKSLYVGGTAGWRFLLSKDGLAL